MLEDNKEIMEKSRREEGILQYKFKTRLKRWQTKEERDTKAINDSGTQNSGASKIMIEERSRH
jgi:hypothetical protein